MKPTHRYLPTTWNIFVVLFKPARQSKVCIGWRVFLHLHYTLGPRLSALATHRFDNTAVLHCTALHCTALHCTTLHCNALHCTALYCINLTTKYLKECRDKERGKGHIARYTLCHWAKIVYFFGICQKKTKLLLKILIYLLVEKLQKYWSPLVVGVYKRKNNEKGI